MVEEQAVVTKEWEVTREIENIKVILRNQTSGEIIIGGWNTEEFIKDRSIKGIKVHSYMLVIIDKGF